MMSEDPDHTLVVSDLTQAPDESWFCSYIQRERRTPWKPIEIFVYYD